MSSLYFFSSLWRWLVVLCFRVPLYKNMYQRNLQQHLIHTYFVIISGCWADKSKWPKHPNAPGRVVSIVRNSQGRSKACQAEPVRSSLAAPKEEPRLLTLGLLCCVLGESLSPLLPRSGWGYDVKVAHRTLALAWWSLIASCSLVWQGSPGPAYTNPAPTVKSAISPRSPGLF